MFAPNSKHRARVIPAGRGEGNKSKSPDEAQEQTPAERRVAMNCAQRLKRVFNIDIETCVACGGAVRLIACIEDPVVIKKILSHLACKAATKESRRFPRAGRRLPACSADVSLVQRMLLSPAGYGRGAVGLTGEWAA